VEKGRRSAIGSMRQGGGAKVTSGGERKKKWEGQITLENHRKYVCPSTHRRGERERSRKLIREVAEERNGSRTTGRGKKGNVSSLYKTGKGKRVPKEQGKRAIGRMRKKNTHK